MDEPPDFGELDECMVQKAKGNELFIKGDFEGALLRYLDGLHGVPHCYFRVGDTGAATTALIAGSEQLTRVQRVELSKLCSNIAECLIRIAKSGDGNKYDTALSFSTSALDESLGDPKNFKARFRRAKSMLGLYRHLAERGSEISVSNLSEGAKQVAELDGECESWMWPTAEDDLEKVLEADPKNRDAAMLLKEIRMVRNTARERLRKMGHLFY
eukprot:gnl/TRDRNA2_/TRDRNA2_91488_c0_seq2.p1 gnl/TRDRNA2_/TRDRNA2_91488_c0~~gnl/TRDRNA2_/TRDRNA2_91488_c0_seq2.p1  ORF type:complete len:214 (-),score=31.56 gnl/TRDRNA2_/TRDRNA2_91488_c0_seq2:65-706(-)